MPRPTYRPPTRSGGIALERYRFRADVHRKWLKPTVAIVAVLLVVGILGTAFLVVDARWQFDDIQKPHLAALTPRVAGQPFDVLFAAGSPVAPTTGGTGSSSVQDGQRAEAIIIARIVPKTGLGLVLSVPTDTYVEIPGTVKSVSGPGPIGRALEGGPATLVASVESAFHLPVNDFVDVNLNGLPALVNALGGIGLRLSYPLSDTTTGLTLGTTGCQRVGGQSTRALVESRNLLYYDKSAGGWQSDYGAGVTASERAAAVFTALSARVGGVDTSPRGLFALFGALPESLSFDTSITESALHELGRSLARAAGTEHSETLPVVQSTLRGGISAELPVPGRDAAMISAFNAFGSASAVPGGVTVTTVAPSPKDSLGAGGTSPASFDPLPC